MLGDLYLELKHSQSDTCKGSSLVRVHILEFSRMLFLYIHWLMHDSDMILFKNHFICILSVISRIFRKKLSSSFICKQIIIVIFHSSFPVDFLSIYCSVLITIKIHIIRGDFTFILLAAVSTFNCLVVPEMLSMYIIILNLFKFLISCLIERIKSQHKFCLFGCSFWI